MENISPQPAFRIIFELAKVDGWYALYDPSNPTTRRISNGHVVSISTLSAICQMLLQRT